MSLALVRSRPATKAEKFFDRNDNFAATVKSFNFEGRQRIHTPVGVILTVIVKVILYSYGLKMLNKLLTGSNPNVITEIQPISFSAESDVLSMDTVSDTDIYNTDKRSFKFAFAMRNYLTREIKHDTNMVEWEVLVYKGTGQDHEHKEFQIGVHKCNASDYENFYAP